MPLIIMHIIDKSTVLHDKSNKYQRTGEVVISYKGIKLSIFIIIMDQYWNTRMTIYTYYHNAIASSKQKTFSFPRKTAFLNCTLLTFLLASSANRNQNFNASTNEHWLLWHYSRLLMRIPFSVYWNHNAL